MKGLARIAAVAGLSVAIAWGMSLLPRTEGNMAAPVFLPDHKVRLTEANMVDALVQMPLSLRVAKADFKQNVMSVDLLLPKGVAGDGFVYHDLYELTRFAWSQTTNVDRLLIRVLQQNSGERASRELLLAMEAKRTDSASAGKVSASATASELKSYLESRYHLTYTMKWSNQL